MFKKVVVSSFLASTIVDQVFAAPGNHSSLEILFAIYGYAFQIYADFSGYTDIAIGIALLLGIRFPPNFDSPYIALSLQDFWRRWHMTLSRWLRDYLYISLGGNRGGRWNTYRNLMLTMLIGGLWHGASWTFVVWGGIHGVGSRRRAADGRPPRRLRPPRAARHARAALRAVGRHLQHRVPGVGVLPVAQPGARLRHARRAVHRLGPAVAARERAARSSPAWPCWPASSCRSGRCCGMQSAFSTFPLAAQGVTLAGCFFLIDALGPTGVAPFIYFQF